jgi:hypothetical protein
MRFTLVFTSKLKEGSKLNEFIDKEGNVVQAPQKIDYGSIR